MTSSQRKRYWRTLGELGGDPGFRRQLEQEFAAGIQMAPIDTSRRDFMKLMTASMALTGLAGCFRQPDEKIVPYVETPEQLVPGRPLFFATAMPSNGFGTGILVESHAGRPTKVEGNPQHPASLGATSALAQASVLDLYDPDRSQVVTQGGQIRSESEFLEELRREAARLETVQGHGLRILAETSTSPTLARQFHQLRDQFPLAKWHTYDALDETNSRAGARLAYGADVWPVYDFSQADVILSLDADFLVDGPGQLRYARQFADRRKVGGMDADRARMNRLYVVESTPTLTGAAADHRWGMRPGEIEAFVWSLAERLGVPAAAERPRTTSFGSAALIAIADDLQTYRIGSDGGGALVIAGESQPPVVHALANAINEHLGAKDSTVRWVDSFDAIPRDEAASLGNLVDAINSGDVEMLLILGGNPVYTAPHDSGFADALKQVPFSVHHALYHDETSAACRWHVPAKHFLESWSDIRAFDGTATIMQPLIAPLYASRSHHELLAMLLGRSDRSAHEIVQDTWRQSHDGADFNAFWRTALHDGVVPGSAQRPRQVSLRDDFTERLMRSADDSSQISQAAVESIADPHAVDVVFRLDPTIRDGRFANNGWLQELPNPLTKLTWGNAALCSPALAERLEIRNEDVVKISHNGRSIEIPVWILPGQPEGVITLHVGHGRTRAGEIGNGVGVDVTPLRPAGSPWSLTHATLTTTGARQPLACTQRHHLIDGRDIVRSGTLDEFRSNPEHPPFMHSPHHPEEGAAASVYPEHEHGRPQWGMSVNLGACIGCNACVVACQAENNTPVVGREEVCRGREMHWLRIDTYYTGAAENPEAFHQPVMCMHCERAPCEVVCPVAATTHSDEGLNEMTYNRCVGTRYCSNNCPYKVRRFNFFDHTGRLHEEPVLQLLQNPDVTVRSRGVMEKCTYCVQRISAARIAAEKEDRAIRDGDVVTACQAACPVGAIVFGDVSDPQSAVHERKSTSLDYALLGELNTRPRTTYLAALRNPHPRLHHSASDRVGQGG